MLDSQYTNVMREYGGETMIKEDARDSSFCSECNSSKIAAILLPDNKLLIKCQDCNWIGIFDGETGVRKTLRKGEEIR